jgi:hypothetical protein
LIIQLFPEAKHFTIASAWVREEYLKSYEKIKSSIRPAEHGKEAKPPNQRKLGGSPIK